MFCGGSKIPLRDRRELKMATILRNYVRGLITFPKWDNPPMGDENKALVFTFLVEVAGPLLFLSFLVVRTSGFDLDFLLDLASYYGCRRS